MSGSHSRILLIDDDALLLRSSAELLHRQGYEVVTATTGQEGLELLSLQTFALAIVDIVLPDINGLDILRTIKRDSPDTVVLLVTGYASLDTAVEALRSGAHDYLRKPFSNSDLTRVVQSALQQRDLMVQNRQRLQELNAANRDLMQQMTLATEELSAFVQLGQGLEQAQTPRQVLEEIVRGAAQLTGAAHGGLVQKRDGQVSCLVAQGEAAQVLGTTDLTDEKLVQTAMQHDKPVVMRHLLRDSAAATGPLALAGFTSALVVPLPRASGAAGALVLLDSISDFDERQASLVKVMAAQAAETIQAMEPAASAAPLSAEFVDLQDLLGER